MDVTVIYAFSIAATVVALGLWHLFARVSIALRYRAAAFLRKHLIYSLVCIRRNGSTDLSLFAGFAILGYYGANFCACFIHASNVAQISRRFGIVSIINLSLLFFGGRTSILADRAAGTSLRSYSLMHRWVGRLVAVTAIIHGLMQKSLSGWRFSTKELAVSNMPMFLS